MKLHFKCGVSKLEQATYKYMIQNVSIQKIASMIFNELALYIL